MSIIVNAVKNQKRFEVVEVPAWTGIRDTQTDETLLSIHTKLDATNGRDMRKLKDWEIKSRVAFVLHALEQTYGNKS